MIGSSDMSEDEEGERWASDLGGESSAKTRGGESSAKTRGCGSGLDHSSPPFFSGQVLENVIENVLQFLTERRDRNSASLVCRSWYRAESQTRRDLFIGNCYAVSPHRAVERFRCIRTVVLKGKPRFADFNLVPADWGAHVAPWLAAMAPAYRGLQRLCLKRMTLTDGDLTVLAGSFLEFRELVLICCDGFTTAGLAAIAENCKNLRALDLIEDYIEEDEEEEAIDWISSFPDGPTALESLVFDCVGCAINFDALEALVARSPQLRRLRVNQHISLEQLSRLMVRAPQLTHLGTGSFRPANAQENDENLASAFAASKSIVCLSGFRDAAPEYLPAIYPVCANLTSLNFSFAQITADELNPAIIQCHNLQNFWVLDTVGDEGLQAVAATCKHLRELRVFPSDPREESEGSVSDTGLLAISMGCPRLRSILYFCQRMTNFAVVTMSKNCRELAVFRLCIMGRHRPDRLTGQSMDEGFGAIAMNCKKLTRLAVSGLLTDKAFEYIGMYGKLVRTLSVAFAGNTDHGLRYVLEGCPKLQKLEIRDSPFGDSALLSGIHHYYNMRFLWMSSCKLSLSGCKAVAQHLPRLVVEVIKERPEDDDAEAVEKLYMYRSLAGPREDVPAFVKIL